MKASGRSASGWYMTNSHIPVCTTAVWQLSHDSSKRVQDMPLNSVNVRKRRRPDGVAQNRHARSRRGDGERGAQALAALRPARRP